MSTDPKLPVDPMGEVLARLGEHTDQLSLLDETVTGHEEALTRLQLVVNVLADDGTSQGPTPVPSPRWHALEGQERDGAIDRLRSWVQRVYVPVYGHLAATLGACWAEHPLALVVLDHVSETWAVLYARPTRSQRVLSAQLEFQLRYLPAAAEQLQAETARCTAHVRPRPTS
jgi:hypothetical protein